MKKKNEENVPEKGCGTKMPAENGTTNEVVETETVKEDAAEEKQDKEEPIEDDGESMAFHASRKDFLVFLQKLLHMMRDIVLLEKSLHEFEKDPIFDMLLDLSMVHLQNMKESDKEKSPSEEDCEEDDKEDSRDEDDNTVAEAFISMKVKKLKS